MSLIKQRLSLAVAWLRVLSKFLTKLLQRYIQAFDRSITHRTATTTNPGIQEVMASYQRSLPLSEKTIAARQKDLATYQIQMQRQQGGLSL